MIKILLLKKVFDFYKWKIGFPQLSYVSIFSKIINRRNVEIGEKTKIFRDVLIDARAHPSLPFFYDNGAYGRIKIGSNCKIKDGSKLFSYDGFILIGDNVSINPYCVIYGNGGLVIGNNVLIATGTIIVSSNHNFSEVGQLISDQGMTCRGITIGDNVWIGANVKILDGVSIGTGCVIAAGSVVNKNVDSNSVWGGIPAKKIKNI